jgi:hypothetical protein
MLTLAVGVGLGWGLKNLTLLRRHAGAAAVRVTAVATVLLILALYAAPTLRTRAESKVEDAQALTIYEFGSGRVATTLGGLLLVADHPMGVGSGNVGAMLPRYVEPYLPPNDNTIADKFGAPYMEPHNTYVSAAAEAGPLAAVLLIAAFVQGFRRTRLAARVVAGQSGASMARYGHSLLAATLGTAVFLFTSDQLFDKYLWLLLAMLATYPDIVVREELRPHLPWVARSPRTAA